MYFRQKALNYRVISTRVLSKENLTLDVKQTNQALSIQMFPEVLDFFSMLIIIHSSIGKGSDFGIIFPPLL